MRSESLRPSVYLSCGPKEKGKHFAGVFGYSLITMRNETTRVQQRIMAKLFSARSGIDAFPH
jgi:hypothetical protein